MKYEDIYFEGSRIIHLGRLMDLLDNLEEEGCSLLGSIIENDDAMMSDISELHIISEGFLRELFYLAHTRLIFSFIKGEEAKDPKSVFLIEKCIHEFDKRVWLHEIEYVLDRIKDMEFDDYRVKHYHLKIYDIIRALYEDVKAEFHAADK